MSDQVAVRLPKTVVPEKTNFTVTANFRTRATKAAAIPTTVHYRVDCLTTCQQLKDWTSVSAAAEVSIAIDSSLNAIQQDSSSRERKQITVQADQGLSTQATGYARWQVSNLYGIS